MMTMRSQRRPKRRESAKKEEGFALVVLLQSVLCFLMLSLAFAAGSIFELGGAKAAISSMLTEESGAMQVFSSMQKALPQGDISHVKQVLAFILEQIDLDDKREQGASGGENPAEYGEVPKSATLAGYVSFAPAFLPLSGGLTSDFGWREHPVSKKSDFHTGIDIAAAEGSRIAAAWPAVVKEVGQSDVYGNFVTLSHGGFESRYCHCSSVAVREGMRLRSGETVAYVGSTGVATGPHLHFEVIVNGKCADPKLSFDGKAAL